MKAQKLFNPDELRVDALDYIFVEWLIRNNLYGRFMRNSSAYRPAPTSTRRELRERIRYYVSNDPSNYSAFVSGAFLFGRTPEGRDFWTDVANSWVEFVKSFNF